MNVNVTGTDTGEAERGLVLPVIIYLPNTADSSENRETIRTAVERIVGAFGLGQLEERLLTEGSWLASFWARITEKASEPEVAARLGKLERALELQAIGRPQAAIDKEEAEAVAGLIQTLASFPDATLMINSILVVKRTTERGPQLWVRSTPTETMAQLNSLAADERAVIAGFHPASLHGAFDKLAQAALEASEPVAEQVESRS